MFHPSLVLGKNKTNGVCTCKFFFLFIPPSLGNNGKNLYNASLPMGRYEWVVFWVVFPVWKGWNNRGTFFFENTERSCGSVLCTSLTYQHGQEIMKTNSFYGTPIISPRLVNLSEVEVKPVDWLWLNKVPYGDITVLAGLQKQGKSMVTVYMASVITQGTLWSDSSTREPGSIILQGRNWCDGSPCERGSVIFFAGEDRKEEYVRRLNANGADLTKIRVLDGADMIDPNSGKSEEISVSVKSLDVIDAAIKLTEKETGLPVRMVVIDPVSNYWGNINEKDNVQVRSALHPLQQFFQARRIVPVLVQHFSKTGGKKAMLRVLGSVALTGIARNTWGVYADTAEHGELESEKNRYFVHIASNCCIDPLGILFRITPEGQVDVVDMEITLNGDNFESAGQGSPPGAKPSALQQAADWLVKFLSDGRKPVGSTNPRPGTVRFEAEKEGHAWATIRKAADILGIVKASKPENGVYYWHLPVTENDAQYDGSSGESYTEEDLNASAGADGTAPNEEDYSEKFADDVFEECSTLFGQDYYEILGVSRTASQAEISDAYRKKAMEYHPDRNRDSESASEKFKTVQAAYDVLKDPEKRKGYDRGHCLI